MSKLITTLGPKSLVDLGPGVILPHEHVFVDLRTPDDPDQGRALTEEVVDLMAPELDRARAAGVAALVECTPVGVGRRVDLDLAVSQAAAFPVVVPTGTYREPWIPDWIRNASEATLADWMLGELTGSVADTGVQAAWIKLSAGDDGVTDCERKVLRAASKAGAATNAVIGSHTIRGCVAMDQLDTLESSGYTAERFIWIHTQAEPDFALHLEMARPGDLAEVIVNGISCGVRAWEPFSWDISEAVGSGQNDLQIKVANSLQNLLLQEPKPSGLLGEVRIVPYKEIEFKLQ